MAADDGEHGPPPQLYTKQATDIITTPVDNATKPNDSNARTAPGRKPPIAITSISPLSRLASPLDGSDISFSPSSGGFLSLLGAASSAPLTPLSSLDGGDAWCPSSVGSSAMTDDHDHDHDRDQDRDRHDGKSDAAEVADDNSKSQDTIFPFGDMPNSAGSEKGEAHPAHSAPQTPQAPVDEVGAVAAATAIATQSPQPIRATGAAVKKGAVRDTRSKKSTGTKSTDNSVNVSDNNTTIAKPIGAVVDVIREADSSAPTTIAPPEDARPRCETSTLTLDSTAAATLQSPKSPRSPHAPQGPQNFSGPATQRVTPNTRANSDENLSAKAPTTSIEASSAARLFAGSISTTSLLTKLVQPKAVKPSRLSPPPPQQPAIVRTTSSHGDLPLRQPKPDPNGGPIGIAGSVAQLEETAEQLSSTGSIETAIREAHQELKRSDSRRSSILAASIRQSSSRAASVADPTETLPRREFSRQSSIIELNSAARSGAFSPNDYIMSPGSSIAGSVSRQRSTSKASSTGSAHGSLLANILGITDSSVTGDDVFPFLSRHGPGKVSVRSARSGQISLPEITELEPPTSLTQDALDEADRRMAAGEDHDDEDTIRASAHQHIEDDDDDVADGAETNLQLTPNQETWTQQPALGSSAGTDSALLSSRSPPPIARPSVTDYLGYASPPQYVMNPAGFSEYTPSGQLQTMPEHNLLQQHTDNTGPDTRESGHDNQLTEEEHELERPATAASGATYEQSQYAFDDFDGVHCDPDVASLRRSIRTRSIMDRQSPATDSSRQTPPAAYKQRLPLPPRPTSYLDPQTGQQMLYYPARVPAMLQLPQKLSRNPKAAERNARRSQVLSMMMQGPEMQQPRQERQSRVWLPDPMEGDSGSHFMSGSDSLSPDMTSPQLTSNSLSPNPLSPALSGEGEGGKSPTRQSLLGIDPNLAADAEAGPATGSTGEGEPGDLEHLRRPSRLIDHNRSKSRMSTMSKLPAQLRASAYFDQPSTITNLQVKNGSAMDTLDSILDAAAAAPVSAFTDHAFAGHLGSEVYGAEKKRPKKKAGAAAPTRPGPSPTQEEMPRSKSRGSFMNLMHIRKVSEPVGDGRSEFEVPRVRRRLSKNFDGAVLSPGLSEGTDGGMAPGPDERVSDDDEYDHEHAEEEDEEDSEDEEDEDNLGLEAYQGAPTTLLAELQLRKQQQKLRTRPINKVFPNGMHSTLLELDAVAEIERRARKGKKVNLAWEDPSMQPLNDSDDEDVPLGMLYAAKVTGQKDLMAVAADMNRPLGLMEKKELEDNEPLSRRRDRLQGRDPGVSMYLGPSFGSNAVKRQSMLTLTPTLAAINNSHVNIDQQLGEDADKEGSENGVEEVEDEPLAARLERIKAKEESELPRARPVSMAFSEELLTQFVDPEEEAKEREKELEKEKIKSQPPAEEEETLGQRRRRLQAEKEARELEMGGSGAGGLAVNGQALHALTGSDRLSRRLSLANVLSAHPADAGRVPQQHPAEAERIRREQETARANFEKDQKMAAMRAQMPRNISNTSIGGGVTKPGGYLGGLLNDGSGGIGALNRTTMMQHNDGPGVGPWANPGTIGGRYGNASALSLAPSATMGNMAGMNSMGMSGATTYGSGLNNMAMGGGMPAMGGGMGMGMNNRSTSYGTYASMPQQNMMGNNGMAYNGYAGMQMPMQMQMPNMNMNMGMPMMPMQMPMQMQMQMQMQPPQTDRVERWRQGVLP